MKSISLLVISLVFVQSLIAQTDSVWSKKPELNVGGFIDVYYAYDPTNPTNPSEEKRQPFLYNHNRHNEFNLNLGYAKLALIHPKYRANFAVHAGTYVADNYASESGALKNVFEGNAGISLNDKNNLWLDAGIFASHIGFESAISIDNWTLTRSLVAENSPYYLSGAKLTSTPNQRFEWSLLVLNGWQRLSRISGNSLPSVGMQFKFTPNQKTTLNYSNFAGSEYPDLERKFRFYHNFYGQFIFREKWGIIAGCDFGMEQSAKGGTAYATWFSPVVIVKYDMSKKWKAAIRGEYFQDEKNVLIKSYGLANFHTYGYSINFDYRPVANVACRLELRWLHSDRRYYWDKNINVKDNVFAVASIAVKLNDIIK